MTFFIDLAPVSYDADMSVEYAASKPHYCCGFPLTLRVNPGQYPDEKQACGKNCGGGSDGGCDGG
jgi:hypothetical protein